ncbi:F-box only protein 40-like isoform X1 [Tachysurus fulvidraco]|uniref:F-box only protein 40-like isoform X1 n=1 Tax=Tachysurus fulvidraco TaxID=1234273 RepID=UPI000F4E2C01|nr:F-box only protein 40-like isoform X1 [Tachysurus fulvidraco]XP_047661856.1 F-box only protein 40-like isoform X1 [Tachysurus fulvidraco]XP_047661857.1 F-box only protein 40-like isoform X1 [Tachysurus fulvidraco]
MGRQRTSGSKLHTHCESCHNRRCKVSIEISVSCMIINCRMMCGASFHMCKEDEHILLCPNEKVPCINAYYGCPFTMCRSKLAKHLEVCPASVVVCSMEWNRWPIEDSEPPEFYKNILNENYTQEPLDLSMALRDQKHLFQSLKMKNIFPELIEKIEEKSVIQEIEGAVGGAPKDAQEDLTSIIDLSGLEPEERELTQEEREAIARDTNVSGIGRYDAWERMFSMELSGCKQTVKTLGTKPASRSTELKRQENLSKFEILKEEMETTMGNSDTLTYMPHFNPYEMDEDKFLIAASLYACDTRPIKTFVYEHLEPMKIKTVRSFKVPTSFKARPSRIRNPFHYKKDTKAVDTADLSTQMEEKPKWDEVQATLLCSLEKELRGHLIAEASAADALLKDEGTQTYDFYSAPFKANASLADLTVDRALQLHVQIHTESVTNRHNKCSSAFTYLCSHSYRRDEFSSHYKNVHSDIQFCLNGWFQHRCPLAYLGCTFSQRQLRPFTHKAMVSYDKDLSTFTLRPEVPSILYEGVANVTTDRKRARNQDALSKLPFEILIHIAGFLDSFTLSQLALVSRLMREVCGVLLQERGMVSIKWEKKIYSHGGWCWRARHKVWEFSNLFYPVDNWCLDNFPSMSEHLKVCPYYEKENRTDPVPLTGVFDCEEDEKAQSLVSMFIRNQ